MMKYEIVAFYKQEIEEIRECAENIGRLYGWRYRCEKIPGSGKLLSACMGEDSVLCLLKRIIFFLSVDEVRVCFE